MTRFVFSMVALTAVYALALASADPWDLAIGAALSLGILLAFRHFVLDGDALPPRVALRRIAHFPRLALATAFTIVRGTVAVSRIVLGWASARDANFVTIPWGDRTQGGVQVNGLLETLSPGSVLVDVDTDEKTWTIHAIEARDASVVRGEIDRFYDRYQRSVWP